MQLQLPSCTNDETVKQIHSWYKQWILVDHLYSDFALSYGISSGAMFILRMLRDLPGGCEQHTVCEYLTMPKQTASSILKTLESSGFVVKKEDEQDRRKKLLFLTQNGAEFIKKISDDLGKIEEDAFESLSEADRRDFSRINEALTEALKYKMHEHKRNGGLNR